MATKKRKRKAKPHARAALRVRRVPPTKRAQVRRKQRRRNPAPTAFPFTVELHGATVARFKSMPRARQYAQALANRSRTVVKVKA